MRGHHPIRTKQNSRRSREFETWAQEFIICVQKIHFKSIKYILFTCILLVEGSNLKNMASESDKSTGKDEDEVKSTPSIIKPKGRTAVGF